MGTLESTTTYEIPMIKSEIEESKEEESESKSKNEGTKAKAYLKCHMLSNNVT